MKCTRGEVGNLNSIKLLMGVAFEEVGREGALGQQRIGGEGLAADVFELVEERNDGADLVGAFRLVVGAELQADFFWV